MPPELVEPFEKKLASPVVTTTRLSGIRKLGSVGQAIPGVQVVILDDEDHALPIGETGEIGVRGGRT